MDPSNTADGADLVGDVGDSAQEPDNANADQNGALAAVTQGVREANPADQAKQDEVEEKSIKKLMGEYETARAFDKTARKGYTLDRKYAAGMSDPSWASDANLIGSDIDILTSFLYAQNPDVGCRAAEQVGEQPDADNTHFAETLELVISRLWKRADLKTTARRQVRSALSVGPGWFKALLWSKKRPQPQVEKDLHDAEAQMARMQALIAEAKDDTDMDPAQTQAEMAQMIGGLRAKIMLAREYGMNVDFVRAEDIQVSLDVSTLSEYKSANWVSEDMYIPKDELRARFPRLTDDDEDRATTYYQKNIPQSMTGDGLQAAAAEDVGDSNFSKTVPNTQTDGTKPIQFVKLIEFWDRRDSNIKTMCDGVKRWCVEPYTPPQASSRFYPYFELEFYPVDGQRHPQSLCQRLKKLQDEYSACRSNQRLTRERSIPGMIVNGGLLSAEDCLKLERSVISEIVVLKPTDINTPIQNIIAEKKTPTVDVRLWDTTAIRQDMAALSGVQEALQQAAMSQQPKTATEAQIQQQGFSTRTSADRDTLEEMLSDLAHYTAELAIQELPPAEAQRIAGSEAFWPAGMDIQDLLTMVEVDINAGTTGKPNLAVDKANWATILPLLQKMMVQIRQVQGVDPALAKALQNLLRESLHRMDDRLDIAEFIPTTPPPPQPPPPPPTPTVSVALKGDLPPLDASMIGAKAAGLPPAAALADGGANAMAMQHASGMHEGELPPHPLMPEPLPEPKPAPHTQGKLQ